MAFKGREAALRLLVVPRCRRHVRAPVVGSRPIGFVVEAVSFAGAIRVELQRLGEQRS
jgi:hypothetical protein